LDDILHRSVRTPPEHDLPDYWSLVYLDGVRLLKVCLEKKRGPLRAPTGGLPDGQAESDGGGGALWDRLLLAEEEDVACLAEIEQESGERHLSLQHIRLKYQRPPGTPRVPPHLASLPTRERDTPPHLASLASSEIRELATLSLTRLLALLVQQYRY